MNLIASLLPPTNIIIDLDVGSKKRVFEQLGLLFENNHGIAQSQVFDCLFAREKLGSTGLGEGVAIPHGRAKGLRETLAAFVRLKNPLSFDAPDGHPVTLLFALLVPEQANETHLQILSELAQRFCNATFREKLMQESDPSVVHQLFVNWQPNDSSHFDPDQDPSTV